MATVSLSRQIMNQAETLPEGALIFPNALLHLGSRSAVDQALSRLAHSTRLLRICQGVYTAPVETRFGQRPPSVAKVIASLSELWGETIVQSGAASANVLGLTTQMQVRTIYLTSGPNRTLRFGEQIVNLQHAPQWQLSAPNRLAGDVIRALAWLGPLQIEDNLEALKHTVPAPEFTEHLHVHPRMPSWIAEPLRALAAYA